jgi:signal transduction histidine kinase
MNKYTERFRLIIGHILPWFILSILLFYTYARFFEHPYLGFRPDTTGRIIEIYVDNNPASSLQRGDRLVKIDNLLWDDFRVDLHKPIYNPLQSHQKVSLQVERAGELKVISWILPGPTQNEVVNLAFNQSWLAYIFWLVGSLTLFAMRPKDERWLLMIAFNYLTAIWVITGGGLSFYHLRESAIVLRMTVWLCVPVYLHLHWIFPKPLSKLSSLGVWGSYLVAIAFAIAEWFGILDINFYYFGFLIAIGGSVIFLILHTIFQPDVRRDLRLLVITALLALLLPAVFGLASTFNTSLVLSGGGAVISLPFLPFGYFFASYRRQLGNLEVRVTRFISIYIFLVLLFITVISVMLLAESLPWHDAKIFVEIALLFLTAVVSITGFPRFQTFVEQRFLGMRLPPAQLMEIYSSRITTSPSSASLQNLLKDGVLPSLLVREFIFLQFNEHSSLNVNVFLALGVAEAQYPLETDLLELIATAGMYRPLALLKDGQLCQWVRLVLPLKMEDKLIGLWLFGRRDPDDLYSQAEIPILQSLAHQTAIAQSNILQSERLAALSLANIDRHEEERLRLAHELHDSVLNQMAVLLMNLGDITVSHTFQKNYDELSHRLRAIVSDLRPPMLTYGLKPALDGLAESLMERSQNISIVVDVEAEDTRYPINIEQHLYRIAQQACENALRHGQASQVTITGNLDPEQISLEIKDDGIGFDRKEGLELNNLLANKHFGLAGMMERGRLIGANVRIESTPNLGTRIQVEWISKNEQRH